MDTRRIFRYIFIFFLVLISTTVITYGKLETQDLLTLALLITLVMLFIDLYYPIVLYTN